MTQKPKTARVYVSDINEIYENYYVQRDRRAEIEMSLLEGHFWTWFAKEMLMIIATTVKWGLIACVLLSIFIYVGIHLVTDPATHTAICSLKP